jgi:hypothetical protein
VVPLEKFLWFFFKNFFIRNDIIYSASVASFIRSLNLRISNLRFRGSQSFNRGYIC